MRLNGYDTGSAKNAIIQHSTHCLQQCIIEFAHFGVQKGPGGLSCMRFVHQPTVIIRIFISARRSERPDRVAKSVGEEIKNRPISEHNLPRSGSATVQDSNGATATSNNENNLDHLCNPEMWAWGGVG